jgi:hypothetical protein
MPFKVIINVDLETGESDNFLWAEKEEPPPLVRPKIKPKKDDLNNKSTKGENKS